MKTPSPLALRRAFLNRDPQRRLMESEWKRRWRATPSGRLSVRHQNVKAKYKLSRAEHDALLIKQNFKCGFPGCSMVVDIYSPIDHDHETGKVRGILCKPHNVGLGYVEKMIGGAQEYLRRVT
jgi:hypothetical protein